LEQNKKMKFIPAILSAFLLFSPLNSCAVFTSQAGNSGVTSQSRSEMPVEHFTLSNGLQVYLTQNTQSPRFRAEIAVKAGSKEDPSEATGIAHYLEHMLFKGTEDLGTVDFPAEKVVLDKITGLYDMHFREKDEKKRQEILRQINQLSIQASQYAVPNEIDAIYSRLGGAGLNAYTTEEETVFEVELPKNRIEQWAMVESNRFAKPVFRLFQPELETVYEEKNRSMDNKERVISEAVDQLLYKVHPYGTRTTLGSIEHLKNPSLSRMYEFYQKYYVPNNMAIFISGDLDLKKTREIITKYFSSWKKKEVPKYETPQEKPLNGVERLSVNYKGEEKVLMAFRAVPYKDPDNEVITLIDMLLDSGNAGLIKLNLVNPQQVRGAGSYPAFNDDYGAEYLYGIPKEGQTLADVEKLLLDQVEKIKKGDFDESLVPGIILSFEIGQKGQLESNSGRVNVMKEAFLRGVSLNEVLNFAQRLKKITKADIIKAANKYFGSNYAVAYRLDKEPNIPKIEKPTLEKVTLNTDKRSPFAKAVEALNPEPIQPKWVDFKKDFQVDSYAPGTLFYYVKNPLNDLFNLSISYEYGSKHSKDLCFIMSELNFAGTGDMTPEQVKNEFFKMGVGSSFSCSDYGFSMNINGLDSQLEKALALSEKVLWNATLDQKHFTDKIKNIITNRADQKKDLGTLRSALSEYVTRGGESAFIDRFSKAGLEKLNVNEYPQLKQELLKQNFRVYYSGQLPMNTVENTVKKYHLPKDITLPLLNPRKEPEYRILKRHDKPVKIYFHNFKGVQAHIELLIPGDPVNPDERLVTSLYNEYFDGGMGAILFQEVREARALAYSTYAGYYQGGRLGDQDEMGGYIGTQADKTIEALKLFIQLLKSPPESQQHFERAISALDNAYRTGYVNFRSVVNSFISWGYLGFNEDPRPESFSKLQTVTQADLKKFIKEKIDAKNLTFLIVGDKERINFPELKKIGEVEEVPLSALFKD
jgi:predicted Zn-dependent peptidase